jgi:ketosteroid isomerase-like protein
MVDAAGGVVARSSTFEGGVRDRLADDTGYDAPGRTPMIGPRWFPAVAVSSALLIGAPTRADDQGDVRALEARLIAAFNAKNVDGIMSAYVPDESLHVFDAIPPREYVGAKAFRKGTEDFLANFPGPIRVDATDLAITTDGKLGFAHYVMRLAGTSRSGSHDEYAFRVTDCLRKTKGRWLIAHEHISFPVDVSTGKADLLSKP